MKQRVALVLMAIPAVLAACNSAGGPPLDQQANDDEREARWTALLDSPQWDEANVRYLGCMEAKGFDYLGRSETDGVILLDGSLFKPVVGSGGYDLKGAYLDFRVATEDCAASSGVDALRAGQGLANPTVNPNRLKAVNDYSIRQMGCLSKRGWAIAEPKVSMGLVVFEIPSANEEERQAFERDRIQCNMELYGSPGGPAIP